MRSTRRFWWQAAGLVAAATAVSPALAQSVPGATEIMALPDDTPVKSPQMLPAPRPAVAPLAVMPAPAPTPAPACGADYAATGSHWSWARWRAEKKAWCQAHLWGYPAEFEAPPLGATAHAHFRTMVANGEAAAMVLYRCDFKDGTNDLNQHGRDRLTVMACKLGVNTFPIVIERTPEAPALAEGRRAAILNVLAVNSIVVPPERVIIGAPIANGMAGSDAEILYPYQIRNMQIQAAPLPIQGGGSGLGTGGTGGGTGAAGGFGAPR